MHPPSIRPFNHSCLSFIHPLHCAALHRIAVYTPHTPAPPPYHPPRRCERPTHSNIHTYTSYPTNQPTPIKHLLLFHCPSIAAT